MHSSTLDLFKPSLKMQKRTIWLNRTKVAQYGFYKFAYLHVFYLFIEIYTVIRKVLKLVLVYNLLKVDQPERAANLRLI